MRLNVVRFIKPILVILILNLGGCATVPKEVVELSYVMGEDLEALHESYSLLIKNYYQKLKDERIDYLNNNWYPRFLENWVKDGQLQSIAKGEVIWSDEQSSLVTTPPGTDSNETFKTLRDWVDYSLYAYQVKEETLLKELNEGEDEFSLEVEKAFKQIIRANATITAHLNSLREVQEVQDETLKALNLKDFRDKINNSLINISDEAAKQLTKIESFDKSIDNFKTQIDSLENIIKK